ncbi:haloalkane dehalogenase [Thalassomonas viridans]|uniref:Haloalkane dehalogenase n=1 Tax=Thalassomonas viridans TaxID=137584 RepID=A0AAF0CAW3_9GAMM|nr:haloalkane dehalogenase [Thalassomonas viridans]WDE06149.1 haloalkane dehalogenase [Thalassomonas viridans]
MNYKTILKGLLTATLLLTLSAKNSQANEYAFEKKSMQVMGHKIAYIDEGKGRPVVFLHGNPTSSYLWRNIIPYVSGKYRAIAPDLIGMGDSDKPGLKYTYQEQATYLHAFLDKLKLKNAVLVVHDWGSALGFHYARTRPEHISAIAFMEATLPPYYPIASLESMGPSAEFLKNVRTPGTGEEMVLQQNVMIDQFLRFSPGEKPLSDKNLTEYNRYYPTPESRQPLLQWLREIPIAGTPANVHEIGVKNNQWLLSTDIPKLLFYVTPGVLVGEATVKYMQEKTKNLEVMPLGPGSHFVQETYPDKIGQELASWLGRI